MKCESFNLKLKIFYSKKFIEFKSLRSVALHKTVNAKQKTKKIDFISWSWPIKRLQNLNLTTPDTQCSLDLNWFVWMNVFFWFIEISGHISASKYGRERDSMFLVILKLRRNYVAMKRYQWECCTLTSISSSYTYKKCWFMLWIFFSNSEPKIFFLPL